MSTPQIAVLGPDEADEATAALARLLPLELTTRPSRLAAKWPLPVRRLRDPRDQLLPRRPEVIAAL